MWLTIFFALTVCFILVGCGQADPESFRLRDAERYLDRLGSNAIIAGEDSRPGVYERIDFNLRGRYTLIRENREPGYVSWDFRMNDFPDLEFNVRSGRQGSWGGLGYILRSNYNEMARAYVFNEFVALHADNPAFDSTKWSHHSIHYEGREDLEIQAQFFRDFLDMVYEHELIFVFRFFNFHSTAEDYISRIQIVVGTENGRFPLILRPIVEGRSIAYYVVEDDIVSRILESYDIRRNRAAEQQ